MCIRDRCIPGQIFHPVKPVDFHHSHKAFQNLVAFETGKHHPRRRSQPHGNQCRRYNYAEHKNRIVFKYKRDVSARLDQAEQAGRLIAGADDGDGDDIDKLPGVLLCLRAGIVKGDKAVPG